MVIDGRTLPRDQHLDTDVCIIGAGPAGIAIARELSGTPFRVCLLESGGLTPDAETQALYRGRLVGHQYFRLDDCRVRRFGGSTNRWGGWTRAMDPIDFEPRAWVADSGWPISYEEIDRFGDRARALLHVPSQADAMRDATGRGGRHVLPLPPDRVETGLLQFSPIIDFGGAYRDALFAAANVQTILYANVTGLERSVGGGAVDRVSVRTLAGNAFTISARVVVLATGAIEIARLLLLSGIGNDHDLVGRYFMEHLHVRCGVLVANRGVDCSFYDEIQRRGREPMAWFILPPSVVRDRRLLAFSASLKQARPAPTDWLMAAQSPAYASALAIVEAVVRGRGSPRWGERLGRSLAGAGDVLKALGARGSIASYNGRLFEIFVRAEQAPNRESRVTLNGARDRLGLPSVDLDWRIADTDRASVRSGVGILAEACAAAGVGQVFVPPFGEDVPAAEAVNGGWHQMGTTRMARDAKVGVVDEQCRVHGVANLFVAGSAVFPTGGFANPTFTILALALRLADHLRVRLAQPTTQVAAALSST
jgi:choline dehydrogenase-like flavoprotein